MKDKDKLGPWTIVTALAVAIAVSAVTGCTTIKRSAIKSDFAHGFAALLPMQHSELTKVADDLYSYRWEGYRTAFITTPEGVIVFDPINEAAAAELAQHILRVAPNPVIRYVIYSHHHEDHAAGASAFPGTPIIVAHANAARDIAAWPHRAVVPPTETFDAASKEITLGGVTIKLVHIPGAHTDGMIVALIPHRKALVVVDFVFVRMMVPFGAPYTSFHGAKLALAELQRLDFDVLIPGHGDIGKKQDVADYLGLLNDMETALREQATQRGFATLHDVRLFRDDNMLNMVFGAQDALEPKYGAWRGYQEMALPGFQWVLFHGIYMSE